MIVAPPKLAKLLVQGQLILEKPPSDCEVMYHYSIFCTLGFPRKMFDGHEFVREYGNGWISLQAGSLNLGNKRVKQSIPYGPMARLLCIGISTIAKRSDSREITLGHSASQMLKYLGFDTQGARHKKLWQQFYALVACSITGGLHGNWQTDFEHPIKRFHAWDPTLGRNKWPEKVLLTEDFFNELRERAVPLDARALKALSGSALAIDIYTWLAYRFYTLKNNMLWLSWANLKEQFGHEYQGKHAVDSFTKAFKAALEDVLIVYPQANVRIKIGGVELSPSPPPVPIRPRRRSNLQ